MESQEVNTYISQFPSNVQEILGKIRELIIKTIPNATETISYGIPTYKLSGKPVVYFAGYKNHIGFYATPTGHEAFAKELSKYKEGRGSVQFPLNEPMPFELIKRIVEYRAHIIDGDTSEN
jgi:uncharacterized protein YdhG (YjbR/CyaY superfamily)